MKKGVLILSVTAVLLLLAITFVVLSGDDLEQGEDNRASGETACLDLGCFEDTEFVGSINSDKYYPCDCRFALQVNRKNIVCFASEGEAESRDYTKSDC